MTTWVVPLPDIVLLELSLKTSPPLATPARHFLFWFLANAYSVIPVARSGPLLSHMPAHIDKLVISSTRHIGMTSQYSTALWL